MANSGNSERTPAPARRERRRRWPYVLGAVLGAPVLLVLALWLALQTMPGRALVATAIEGLASSPGARLEIGALEGAPPGEIVLRDVTLSDTEGVWLRLDRARLDWAPLDLISGRADIAALELGTLAIPRAPRGEEAPAEPAALPDALPELPVEVAIERFAAERIELGAALLGTSVALTAEGHVRITEDDGLDLSLRADQLDAAGRLGLTAAYQPGSGNLELDIDGEVEAGSGLARLAGLPGAPGLELAVSGEGAVPGWSGTWRFGAGDTASADGTLGVESLDPLRLRLAGTADVATLLPEAAAGLARPRLELDLVLGLDTERDLIALDIDRFSSQALSLNGEATLSLPDEAIAAELSLIAEDATALGLLPARTSYERIALGLDASGTLGRPVLDVSGEASVLAFGDISLDAADLALRFDSSADAGGLALELGGRGLAGPPALGQALGPSFEIVARGEVAGDRLEVTSITGESGPLGIEGSASAALDTGAGEAMLTLSYTELARLSDQAGIALAGRMTADLQAELDADGAIDLYIDGAAEAFEPGDPALAALLGATPHLVVDASLTAEGGYRLRELRLDAAGITASGEAVVPADDGGLDGTLQAAIPALDVLAAGGMGIAGAAELSAELGGTLAAPQLDWRLAGREVAVAGARLGAVRLDGNATGLPPGTEGRLDFASGSPAGDIAGDARFTLGEETLAVRDFELRRGQDRLSGAWTTRLAGLLSEGRLQWRIADLAAYGELAAGLSGGLSGDVELAAAQGGQTIALNTDLQGLGFGETVDLGATDVRLRITDALAAPALDGTVTVTQGRIADVEVARARARFSGGFGAIDVELDAEAQAVHPITLDAAAEVALGEAIEIGLQRFELMLGEQPVRLRSPASLVLAGERIELDGLAMSLADGSLEASAVLGGGRAEVDVTGRALPVRLVAAFVPEIDPRGTVDLDAEIAGSLPRPQGSVSLSGKGLRLAPAIVPDQAALALDLQAELGDGRARGRLTAVGIGDPPLAVEFDAPLLVTAPLGFELPNDEPFSASSQWDGRLKPVMALVPVDSVRIEGRARLEASVDGTLDDPVFRGSFAIDDGVYENFEIGTLLRPFTLEVRADGPRLEIVRFEGEDTNGGTVGASGTIELGGEATRFDLRASADGARLVRTDEAETDLDAELTLSGSTDSALLQGEVETNRVEISIAEELPPDVQQLDVRVIDPEANEPADPAPPPEVPKAPGLSWLALDVHVEIPQELFIRGRGLDSEWAGAFDIGGTAASPAISGDIHPVRGGFDIAGKRFVLAEGSISFSGGQTIDPILDITAVYDEDGDFTARVNLSGSTENPQIDIGSEPALPRDEVISRVLFGKGTGQLNALQGAQVAQTAARLTGGGGGMSVLDMARDALGVDVLTLAPGASEENIGAIEAGKYIADDVFIGVRQGTTPGSTGAIVEWEVTPNITVESEAGAANESSVGVRWEWDY